MNRWVGSTLYSFAFLLMASCHAWNVSIAPFDCVDSGGHGPAPGSRECNYAIMQAQAQRPAETQTAFFGILAFGAALLGLWTVGKALTRRGYFVDGVNEGSPRD